MLGIQQVTKKVGGLFQHLSSFHRVGKDRREIKQTTPRHIYSSILRPLNTNRRGCEEGKKKLQALT